MPKTSRETVTRALRLIGVVNVSDEASASYYEYGRGALSDMISAMTETQGFDWSFDVDTVPDHLFEPMAEALAAKIAPAFMVNGPTYHSAVARLRALDFPDDREATGDLDDDGTISDAEAAAASRAAYY